MLIQSLHEYIAVIAQYVQITEACGGSLSQWFQPHLKPYQLPHTSPFKHHHII